MNLRRKTQKVVDGKAPIDLNLNLNKPLALNDLKGKRVCVTGTITNMTRERAHFLLRNNGIIAVDTVTSDTDFLIAGFGVGQTKLKAAAKFRIPVINAVDIF